MSKKGLLFLVVLFVFLVSGLWAQIPQLINYQGMLTDPATGSGLTGTYSITFSIYDAATGGTALWTETQSVTANNGLFNVLLGSVNVIPLDLFDGSDRYLGVKVGADPEMTPRQKLVSVGYSFKANDANQFLGKDTSDFVRAAQENSVSTEMIQDNAVTAAKVQPAILSSLDGVSNDGGNIDLVAGSNVTITPDDNNNRITIAATGGGGGDNLGDHTATQNLNMNGHWISGDGENEGLFVQSNGFVNVGAQSQSNSKFYVEYSASDVWQYGLAVANPNLQTGNNIMISTGKGFSNKNIGNIYFHYQGNQSNANRLSLGLMNVNDVLNITGSGRVGIGLTNPQHKLDVNGTVKMTGFKMATGASTGKVLTSDASGNGTWQTAPGPDNLGNHTATQNVKLNGNWLSGDGGNEGVYVKSDGKVGIGTSSPNSTFKSVGNGSIGAANNSATGTYAVALGEDCGAADAASIAIGKSCSASAAYAVAIGRNATANNLNCVSAGYYCNAYGIPSVAIGSRIAVGGSYSVGIGLDNTQRQVTASHVLAIMGGKVGIGVLNPSNILTVQQGSPTDPIADSWSTYSSRRWKTNVHEIKNAVEKVLKLRGVSFNWKKDNKKDIGLIAEEVGEVFPEIVAYEENGIDAKGIDYSRLVAVLIEAVKEQQKEIEALKKMLDK